jgi:membrane-associated phospholipid phosphatase
VRAFSALGTHAAVWLVLGAAGMAVDPARRERWRRGEMAVAGAYALNTALKLVVRRRRPRVRGLPPLTATPTGLSFPSAHATTGFTAARAFAPLTSASALYGLAWALALSRIYLGVHYPSDVLAGAALGALIGGWAAR